jgi:branched-chain amino acid transport system permease protein
MAVQTETLAPARNGVGVWLVLGLLALAGLLVVPFWLYPVFLMNVMCFALFASAFNLLVGYVGLLSFGHAAFFGGAAYFTAHAVKVWGWEPAAGILLGVAGAAVLGVIVGYLAIRRTGIYFSMITLALSQLFYFICLQAPFTHGEDGIQGVPRGRLFGAIDLNEPLAMYYLVLAIFLFGLFAVWRIVNSPFGNILKAIRENENRAISLGYRVERYKLAAFVMSAALAGLAGGTKALVFQLATLTDVSWQMSGEVILMTLLGGIGTMLGPTVGAAFVVALQNYLAASAFPVTVLIGIIFVVCVLLFRRGMVGELLHYLDRRRVAALAQSGASPADRVMSAGAAAPPARAATPEARSDRSAGLDAVGPDRPAV